MTRVLIPPGTATTASAVLLDEDEQHHLKVRRVAVGARVAFTDGAGIQGTGHLVAHGRQLAVEVTSVLQVPMPLPLVLGVGAGDRDRFGWLVEKATELGVTDVAPLETEHTRSVATGVRADQLDKLRRRAREGLKQCGGAWVPRLREPELLESFLRRSDPGARWMLDASGGAPPALDPALPACALVGPEGGLSDSERALALALGFVPVSAGPQNLRFETAAIAAAVLVQAARRT